MTMTILIEEDEVDLVLRYSIKVDSDGDRVLFMAYYAVEDGVQTNELAEKSCFAYVDSVNGADEDYYDGKLAYIPDWCDFADPDDT